MAHQIQKIVMPSKSIIGVRFLSSKIGNSFDNIQKSQSNKLHLAVQRDYPQAEALPLPPNVDPNEVMRFSPLRNRDVNGSAISVHQSIDVTSEQRNEPKEEKLDLHDAHLESYDRSQPVNLSCIMQSFVPEPFSPPMDDLRSSYLSFPGGSWGQQTKYLSHELNSNHYTQLRQDMRSDWSSYKGGIFVNSLMPSICSLHPNSTSINHKRFISFNSVNFNHKSNDQKSPDDSTSEVVKETGRQKLKKAVKEYGATVVIFHVGISLISLGFFYTLVSSGLDVNVLLEKLNLADKAPSFAENASTFIIAYAVHKVFAPVRITITVTSTPFIVRYLRNKKILK